MNKPMTCWMVKNPNGKGSIHDIYETYREAEECAGRLIHSGWTIVKVEIREIQ